MKRILILLIAAITSYGPTVRAQPQQSENFRITKSVLDAGGAPSSSANFQLVSAFGQPTPIGLQSSANFILSAGFLSPMFAVSPLSPITNLVIQRMPALSMNVKLDWGAILGAQTYYIYRDTNPLFTPAPENLIGSNTTNTFTDIGAVGLPATRYFYIVTANNDGSRAMVRDPGKSTFSVTEADN